MRLISSWNFSRRCVPERLAWLWKCCSAIERSSFDLEQKVQSTAPGSLLPPLIKAVKETLKTQHRHTYFCQRINKNSLNPTRILKCNKISYCLSFLSQFLVRQKAYFTHRSNEENKDSFYIVESVSFPDFHQWIDSSLVWMCCRLANLTLMHYIPRSLECLHCL